MIGFIPIAIAAIGAAMSIAKGISDSNAAAAQASSIAEAIDIQIEQEEKLKELRQDTRLIQENEARWQRTREKILGQLAKRQDVLASRVEMGNQRIATRQARTELQGQAFDVAQQGMLQQQQLTGEQQQLAQGQQQRTAETAQMLQESIPSPSTLPTESLQDLANLQQFEDIRQQYINNSALAGQLEMDNLAQDQKHALALYDRQSSLALSAIEAQHKLVTKQQQTVNTLGKLQREQRRKEYRAQTQASRANMFAEKALAQNMREADEAEYQARLASLVAQQPVSQNNTLGIISGAFGQIAPIVGSAVGNRPSTQPRPSTGLAFANNVQLPSYSGSAQGISYTPGSAGLTGGQRFITTPPPSVPRTTLYSGFPNVYSNAG